MLPLVLPDNNRVYVRKAQFHFGWDWGAKFVGCGVWKDVRLEGWDEVKLSNLTIKRYKTILGDSIVGINYIEKSSVNIGANKLTLKNLSKNKSYIIGRYDLRKGTSENNLPIYYFTKPAFNNYLKEIKFEDILELEISKNNKIIAKEKIKYQFNNTKLIQVPDSIGTSFYFEQNGKPIYAKGANWIPANIFLPSVKKEDYRKLLQRAKDANMNMLRVWGGGIYEADEFYDLCDEMGIMVWQDFMFAGGMYPADEAFLQNVKAEVKYQIERLRHHPCIVLWCGNNEIDEAWKNWGWQNQYNLHNADSAKIWNDYKKLFVDSLQAWVNEFDGTRPYISTSPKNSWGHKESLTEGDSHYWGVWWGLENWEVFENKTGRFVSEYGMQAMPNWNTVKSYTNEKDRFNFSPIINAHQKANEGFKKLNHYLNKYFIDTNKLSKLSLENYTYLTQCLQYYILKNSIAMHRSKYPKNMGTLLWQLNDCWPVTSWSITDFSREPKAAWYAVKEGYRDDILPTKDSVYPKNLLLKKGVISFTLKGNQLTISSAENAKYIELSKEGNTSIFSSNYFDLKKGETKIITVDKKFIIKGYITNLKIKSLYNVLQKNYDEK